MVDEWLPVVSVTTPGMHAVRSTVTFTGALAARYAMPIGTEGESGRLLATGVLMVFAVLVLLFARVFQPITILSALPLSIGGAALALFLAGDPMSLPVVIGFLMLMGIAAKNSILLVDFAIEEIRAGKDRMTALLEAGHKRARPT